MKVYLDNCSLQRPLDDRSQPRIALEALAVISIITQCEKGSLALLSSEALLFEIRRAPARSRQEYAEEILLKATEFIQIDEDSKARATLLGQSGITPLDALHLALAEKARADYFCTCDDKLLKKAKLVCAPGLKVVSPLELLKELEDDIGS